MPRWRQTRGLRHAAARLSAQTETTLQRTFGPLGKTISALYGSIGVSGFDEDAIRERNIVVATPEKLDFALRNDPSLLDDVGLLVFDEGHMIGINEREVRYEVQIQRLFAARCAPTPDRLPLGDLARWRSARRLCRMAAARSPWRSDQARLAADPAAVRRGGLDLADRAAQSSCR